MAGAVPCALGFVPIDGAPEVRAGGGAIRGGTGLVAIDGDGFAVDVHHASRSARHRALRQCLGAGESVADHVIRIVLVLADIVPRGAHDLLASRIEKLAPRILAADDAIGSHHRREGTEGQTVAAESGASELAVGGLANIRQPVRRFDDLPRPAVSYFDVAVHPAQRALEAIEADAGVACLPR